MKPIKMIRLDVLNPWLNDLSPKRHELVKIEIAKQYRAYKDMINGTKPQRTTRRIIERSKRRINWIIAEEMVKK